jgi:hypothetical protein
MSEITDDDIDGMMDWYDQALASGQVSSPNRFKSRN